MGLLRKKKETPPVPVEQTPDIVYEEPIQEEPTPEPQPLPELKEKPVEKREWLRVDMGQLIGDGHYVYQVTTNKRLGDVGTIHDL